MRKNKKLQLPCLFRGGNRLLYTWMYIIILKKISLICRFFSFKDINLVCCFIEISEVDPVMSPVFISLLVSSLTFVVATCAILIVAKVYCKRVSKPTELERESRTCE